MNLFDHLLLWIYSQFLGLYPPRFRDKFGDEMRSVFTEGLAEAAILGSGSVLLFCGRELLDLPASLIREHLREGGKEWVGRVIFYPFGLLALTIACWMCAALIFPFQGLSLLPILVLPIWLSAPALAWAAKRLSTSVWISAGLIILFALLVVPNGVSPEFGQNMPVLLQQPAGTILGFTIFFLPAMAVVVVALLLSSGLTLCKEWRHTRPGQGEDSQAQRQQAGRIAAVTLALGAFLVAVMLLNLYWLMVWDSTDDPLDYLWLIFPILAALFAGLVLAIALPGRTKLTGLLYALLLPALMLAVSVQAKSIDFRQLTQERAGQVSQAIETYYAREGHYPQNLHQLTPWYVLSLPGPVIIYGQDWCYDGGRDYYRLGYADREHWSSPIFTGHVYMTKGAPSNLTPICTKEIAALRKRFP